jgi:hypothetical protein
MWSIERRARDGEGIEGSQQARGSNPVGSIPRPGYDVRMVQLPLRWSSFRGLAGQKGRCLTEEAHQGLLVGDKIAQQDL